MRIYSRSLNRIILFGCIVSASAALAPRLAAIDITQEHGIEPNCVVDQVWNLEAVTLTFDANEHAMLNVIGGFDARWADNNHGSGLQNFRYGDIFFYTGSTRPTSSATGASGQVQYVNVRNDSYTGGGYQYVIHFDNYTSDTAGIGNGSYTVYGLDADSMLRNVAEGWNDGGQQATATNPWRYVSGGNEIGTGGSPATVTRVDASNSDVDSGALATYGFAASDNWANRSIEPGGNNNTDVTHYILTIDLTATGLKLTQIAPHVTVGCGNAVVNGMITGQGTPAPDGGMTMMLLGFGLTAVAGLARKR
jgi:hypothetical protein